MRRRNNRIDKSRIPNPLTLATAPRLLDREEETPDDGVRLLRLRDEQPRLEGGSSMFSLSVPISSEGGDRSFQNNVPDPVTSGKELPTFKFELEKSEGRVMDGSFGKEATVEQLPISKGLAGVSMRMEPGVMRELHWRATAAEWAYVTDGRVRTTVVDPNGCSETNDFEPGDIWYFPRGHGHVIQTLGDKPCHFILVFDNGYFSEFGTFSITDWMGHAPKELLARNFGLPASSFDSIPKNEVYFAKGKIPPAIPPAPLQGWKPPPLTHKYSLHSQKPFEIFEGGVEWRADGSQFPISTTMTEMKKGGAERAALASERKRVAVRARRPVSGDIVRLARAMAPGNAGPWGRRLYPAGVRTLDRKHRRWHGADPHRLQHGSLSDDRPLAVDRRQLDR